MDRSPTTTQPAARSRRRPRRRPRLLVLGDLALDVVVRPERSPATGSDVPGTISFRVGGSAANTARAFAALGGEASFCGAVGDDALGRRLVRALRGDGVRVNATAIPRQPTARLAVLVGARGERTFVTQRGAADWLRRRDVRAATIARADALHLPAYSLVNQPLSAAASFAIGEARRARRLVSLDLASHRPLLAAGRAAARRLVGEAAPDLIFANLDEARALGADDGRRLLELAPVVVIKEGAAGCRVLWLAPPGGWAGRDERDVLALAVATTPLKSLDTTGAGDAFDAGFLHSLLEVLLTEPGAAGDRTHVLRRAHILRRAAMAGHRAAAALLTRPRAELAL